jgi:proline iminopeptidase
MRPITRRGGLAGAAALSIAGASSAHVAASTLVDGAAHVPLNGVDHWYRIAGPAGRTRPLVIVHGGPGGNAYVYEHLQGPWLEKRRTVVYYDQRGGGRSAAPSNPADYGMPALVADLDALIRHLGQTRVDLLGFSFGAELALEYALAHPERLAHLVLQSPNGGDYVRMAATETYGFASLARGEDRARLERLAREPIASPAARLAELWKGATDADVDSYHYHRLEIAARARQLDAASGFQNSGLMNAVMFSDQRARGAPLMARAAAISTPALVMVGAYDRTTGVDVARDLALVLGGARLAVFSDSAHFPCYEEADLYSRIVGAFVGEDVRPV